MAYRNRTYVIFDGDTDIWAYRYMNGWRANERIDFDFHDAHELNVLTDRSGEDNTKRKLRERLANTKQAVVLVGENTKNLYRFVRWEIETCQEKGIPIVAVNLNGDRRMDPDRCPPILRGTCTVHVAYRAKIIKHALDDFCDNYARYKGKIDLFYPDTIYEALGL